MSGKQPKLFRLLPGRDYEGSGLLKLLHRLNPTVPEPAQAIAQRAKKCPAARHWSNFPDTVANYWKA